MKQIKSILVYVHVAKQKEFCQEQLINGEWVECKVEEIDINKNPHDVKLSEDRIIPFMVELSKHFTNGCDGECFQRIQGPYIDNFNFKGDEMYVYEIG